MSCIAGVFTPGAPVADRSLIERMLAPMRRRAPHGIQLHCLPQVGLGQAHLRTGAAAAEQANALTLDGQVFIAADCRIDGRAELVHQLKAAGRGASLETPHAELVLHAYHAFGDAFTTHLLGDFSFALWDARRGRLICARDHLGIRPFYYAFTEDAFVFGSQPDAVLAHPGVSPELDQDALSEFLMFGTCLDPSRTVYQQVRCLPRASCLVHDGGRLEQTTYWSFPTGIPRRSGPIQDHVEGFAHAFAQAVQDRLPDGATAVQLSGGMDSTSIAAVASEAGRAARRPVTAHHLSFSSLMPEHDETAMAALVANALQIRLTIQDVSDYPLFDRSQAADLGTPLPVGTAQLSAHRQTLAAIESSGARVLLSGYGGDAVLAPDNQYFPGLLRSGRLAPFARGLLDHYRHARSLRGLGLKAMMRRRPKPDPAWKPQRPAWIRTAHADADLDAKWDAWWTLFYRAATAEEQLQLPWTSRPFEENEYLPAPVIWRYPLLDVRLIRHLQGVPNHLLVDKKVLRLAMHNRLPPPLLVRPKTVLPIDVVHTLVTNGKIKTAVDGMPPGVDPQLFAAKWGAYLDTPVTDESWTSGQMVLPVALNNWMSSVSMRSASHES